MNESVKVTKIPELVGTDSCIDIVTLYNNITKKLARQIDKIKEKDPDLKIEIYFLNPDLLKSISTYANVEIGYLHEHTFGNVKFKVPLKMTIRELFFSLITKYDLSFQDKRSYNFLDLLTFSSNEYLDKDGNIHYEELKQIKLSTIMGHRFDGKEYSFNEECSSFIQLKRGNLLFFSKVVILMKYLQRKDDMLYIDYPQFFEKINGEYLVQSLSLDKMHRTYQNDCIYYNNLWIGNETKRSKHSNQIMAILSYLKFNLESYSPNSIYSDVSEIINENKEDNSTFISDLTTI